MNLLEDIQQSAVDANTDLGTVLRKCKLLAARIESPELTKWVISESNGYRTGKGVPDYRRVSPSYRGNFSGYFGAVLNNMEIPIATMSDYKGLHKYSVVQSVSGLEELLRNGEHTLQLQIPGLAQQLGQTVYKNYNCIAAWADISSSSIFEVVNAVRNRVLDFSIELWKLDANMGSTVGASSTMEKDQVKNIFNLTINGGNVNVVGDGREAAFSAGLSARDIEELIETVTLLGVPPKDAEDLKLAVQTDQGNGSKGQPGKETNSWIASLPGKLTDGTLTTVSGSVIAAVTEAVKNYFS